MNALIGNAHDRAWKQLARTAGELEEALGGYERSRYKLRRGGNVFAPDDRWRDSIATALRELRDVRRRIHVHHPESLPEDIMDVISLAKDAGFRTQYFEEHFSQVLPILDVAEAELLYEVHLPSISTPQLIVSVSDALLAELARQPRLLYDLPPRRFEEIVAELFRKEGFDVQLTQATRDGGTDIIAFSSRMDIWQKLIIECKRYAPENRVGIAVVQRLLGVKAQMSANKAVVVTTSTFSRDAQMLAREKLWDLDLKAYNDVVGWLRAAVPH